jgi:hypothetical protein
VSLDKGLQRSYRPLPGFHVLIVWTKLLSSKSDLGRDWQWPYGMHGFQSTRISVRVHPKGQRQVVRRRGLEPLEGEAPERYAFMRKWLHTVTDSIEQLLLMDISGDSMEPTLLEGDMVLIDRSKRELLSDGIYAVGEENFAYVKQLQRRGGKVVVISDNPIYKEYIVEE